MTTRIALGLIAGAALAAVAGTANAEPKSFKVDPLHSSLYFMVNHLGYANVLGRFNDFEGDFAFDDKNPTSTKVKLIIKIDSIDTNDSKRADGSRSRDEHLRSPDFFNSKEFPTMTFREHEGRNQRRQVR